MKAYNPVSLSQLAARSFFGGANKDGWVDNEGHDLRRDWFDFFVSLKSIHKKLCNYSEYCRDPQDWKDKSEQATELDNVTSQNKNANPEKMFDALIKVLDPQHKTPELPTKEIPLEISEVLIQQRVTSKLPIEKIPLKIRVDFSVINSELKEISEDITNQILSLPEHFFVVLWKTFNEAHDEEMNCWQGLYKLNTELKTSIFKKESITRYYNQKLFSREITLSKALLKYLNTDLKLLKQNDYQIVLVAVELGLLTALQVIKEQFSDDWALMLKKVGTNMFWKALRSGVATVSFVWNELASSPPVMVEDLPQLLTVQALSQFNNLEFLFLKYTAYSEDTINLLLNKLEKHDLLKTAITYANFMSLHTVFANKKFSITQDFWEIAERLEIAKQFITNRNYKVFRDLLSGFDSIKESFKKLDFLWKKLDTHEQKAAIMADKHLLLTLVKEQLVMTKKGITDSFMECLRWVTIKAEALGILQEVLSVDDYIIFSSIVTQYFELTELFLQAAPKEDYSKILMTIQTSNPLHGFAKKSNQYNHQDEDFSWKIPEGIKLIANKCIAALMAMEGKLILTAKNQALFFYLIVVSDQFYLQPFDAQGEIKDEAEKYWTSVEQFMEIVYEQIIWSSSFNGVHLYRVQAKGLRAFRADLIDSHSLEEVYELFVKVKQAKRGLLRYQVSNGLFSSQYADTEFYRDAICDVARQVALFIGPEPASKDLEETEIESIKEIYQELKRCKPLLCDWTEIMDPLAEIVQAIDSGEEKIFN